MFNTPKDAPDSFIRKLSEDEADVVAKAYLAEHLERALTIINPETIFSAPRRRMEFDRVPVGHDIGYRCYDAGKHDADSAFQSGEYGDGLSENEAYADWLRQDAENNPKPRPSKVIHTSRFEPDDYASRPEPEQDHGDERDFDTDLEPRLSDD